MSFLFFTYWPLLLFIYLLSVAGHGVHSAARTKRRCESEKHIRTSPKSWLQLARAAPWSLWKILIFKTMNGTLSLGKGLLGLFLRRSNCAVPQPSVLSTAWFEVEFKNSWKFLPILQQAQSNREQLFPKRDVSAVHSTTWTATNTAFLPNGRRAAYFVSHCTSSSNWTRITHCEQLTEPYMHLQLLLEPLSRAHTCIVYTRF